MLGYSCNRCKKIDPGNETQRDGRYKPDGWMEFGFAGIGTCHLCADCREDFKNWLEDGL